VRLLPLLPSYPFLTTILWPIGYRRTVSVLVHETNAGHALFRTGGIHYALEELRGSETEPTPPTENNKRLAALVVKYVSSRDKGTLTSMFNLALRWKDSKLWSSVIFNSGRTPYSLRLSKSNWSRLGRRLVSLIPCRMGMFPARVRGLPLMC
jgi:hypothetical protein